MIAPHLLDGRLLADGGILDPLPMAPIAAVNADLTIGVSLFRAETVGTADDTVDPELTPTRERLNKLVRNTSALWERFGTGAETTLFPAEPDEDDIDDARQTTIPKLGGFAVMNRTIEIAQAALARHQMATYPPDLLIEVPRTACRSMDFHRAGEVIQLGRDLTARALDNLNE